MLFHNIYLRYVYSIDSVPLTAIFSRQFKAQVDCWIRMLAMTDSPDPKRLDALEAKLDAKRRSYAPEVVEEHHLSQAQAGWRMVTELVVGLLLGFGIGFGLDTALGTLPVFLIIFSLLGFAGGVRAMMRSAEEITKKNVDTKD